MDVVKPRSPASERVLVAGTKLFADSGFLATSIRDVTAECGLTSAAFYNHFESKESLLYTIVGEANLRLESQLDALDLGTNPPEALSGLVRNLIMFNLTSPKMARVANREYIFLQPPLLAEVIAHRRRIRSMFEYVLSSDQVSDGLLPKLPGDKNAGAMEKRLLSISIINLSIASSDWYRPGGPLGIVAVADSYCRLALRMAGLSQGFPVE
jgi:AcrR family transcriptional regulator